MDSGKNSRKASDHHGILLIDKPPGITSHDVVDRVRKAYHTRRVGHTGTLDPQATGLLVLLLGEATKISEQLMGMDKSYEGVMQIGVTSDTYDLEGEVEKPENGTEPPATLEAWRELITEFIGEIDQEPPIYSAKKVGGKKLYEYARKKAKVHPPIKARKIRVDDFELLEFEGDRIEFGVDCSAGTYVRSLVHDLGRKAGCGALLAELRRTDVGPFGIEDAHTVDEVEGMDARARRKALIPLRRALPTLLPVYLIQGAERWVRNGQAIPHNLVQTPDDHPARTGSNVLLLRLNGVEVAIARVDPAPMAPPPKVMVMHGAMGPWYQPIKQFDIANHDEFEDYEDEEE